MISDNKCENPVHGITIVFDGQLEVRDNTIIDCENGIIIN